MEAGRSYGEWTVHYRSMWQASEDQVIASQVSAAESCLLIGKTKRRERNPVNRNGYSQMGKAALMGALCSAVNEIDKDVPVYRVRILPDYLSQSIAQPRLNAMLVGLFAVIALLLAAAGIFGVMSYSVAQRTQEIGIRLALGAQRFDVLRLVIFQGMRFVLAGVVLGLIGVFLCTRLLQSLLVGIAANDLATMVAVSVLLASVAFLACLVPARRATRVDPIVALRTE